MMFKSRFHPGIQDGTVTVTYRYWKRPQARVGSIQKVNPIGHIEVISLTVAEPAAVTDNDAASAGFDNASHLLSYLQSFDNEDRILYRIEFRYRGHLSELEPDRSAAKSDDAIAEIDRALDLRDRNSRFGPWTRMTLDAVYHNPGASSAVLAETLGRDRAELKSDMRKLKKLGLTISLEVGYRLSERGESYVTNRLRRGD